MNDVTQRGGEGKAKCDASALGCDSAGGEVKICLNLREVIYECPLIYSVSAVVNL